MNNSSTDNPPSLSVIVDSKLLTMADNQDVYIWVCGALTVLICILIGVVSSYAYYRWTERSHHIDNLNLELGVFRALRPVTRPVSSCKYCKHQDDTATANTDTDTDTDTNPVEELKQQPIEQQPVEYPSSPASTHQPWPESPTSIGTGSEASWDCVEPTQEPSALAPPPPRKDGRQDSNSTQYSSPVLPEVSRPIIRLEEIDTETAPINTPVLPQLRPSSGWAPQEWLCPDSVRRSNSAPGQYADPGCQNRASKGSTYELDVTTPASMSLSQPEEAGERRSAGRSCYRPVSMGAFVRKNPPNREKVSGLNPVGEVPVQTDPSHADPGSKNSPNSWHKTS
ncbi:hypothetical protein TWF730_002793 [Orbilia blumenaviensis]|uniref:Uncharacterized protein n=1 Tax=Orbilia blumenaviensis TaxID=1796055 RepID=A0AAV9U6X5_9PEZI